LFFLIEPVARFSLKTACQQFSLKCYPPGTSMILPLITLAILSLLCLSCGVAPFLSPGK